MTLPKDLLIYQTKSGSLELKGDYQHETIWANLQQIAELFGRDKSVVSRHIKKIFSDEELSRNSVVAFFATTASDGKTYNVEYFNLDLILSVGYRVNSKTATKFRQWATKTLREHITKGFTINRNRVKNNYDVFLKAVEDIKALLPSSMEDSSNIAELIKSFAVTWLSLDAYDRSLFPTIGATKKEVAITAEELIGNIHKLKSTLMEQKRAGDLFAIERGSGLIEGIVGNVFQSFANEDVYPSIELKAANLLYFIVKNHPFADGNKRSGAFAFIWFLNKANMLDKNRLSPEAITAITLLTAESKSEDKEKIIGLILSLISPNIIKY